MRLSFNTILKLSIFHPSNSHRYFPSSLVKSHTTKTLTMNSLRHCCSASQPTTTTAASAVVSVAPQKEVKVKDAIELTETEKQIFERLVNTLRYFDLKTQLRVAGGWVRDKLLGKDCYDIDIALDDMLGSEFVEKVKEYLLSQGEEVQGLAVIPSNPEQSKHLEIARMRLLDIWIDFVNLRSEKYSENSRIPTMTFGSAEEDALRRDLTINSLFYNINTSSVEDLTGRGIEDLKNGRIVTPLPPKETFLDDPLRVLRAIRFGARFGFVLDEKLKEAASCDDVKDALKAKVSRERIGTEIDLMISGNQPVKAMTHICDLGLFWVVFNLPKDCEPPLPQGSDWLCTAYMNATWNLIEAIGHSTFTNDKKRIAFYSALFLPLRNTIYKDSKGRKLPVVSDIFRTSLKGKTNDAETVINVHNSSKKFLSMIPSLEFNKDCELIRVDWVQGVEDVPVTSKMRVLMGFLLRETKEFWRVSLLMSLLLHPKEIDSISDISEPNFQLNKRRELFQTVENTTERLGLTKVWEEKPLLNGKDIMSVLQLKTGGPLIKEWQQKVLAWQLAHPSGSAEECLEWMRESHSKRMKLQ